MGGRLPGWFFLLMKKTVLLGVADEDGKPHPLLGKEGTEGRLVGCEELF